jgi:hypothetical protein
MEEVTRAVSAPKRPAGQTCGTFSRIGYNYGMSPLKPYQLVASKFQISQESAKYFLGRVQKSFKKEKPPHALILEFIESNGFDSLPEAFDVALLMHENGVWTYELGSTPAIFADEEE